MMKSKLYIKEISDIIKIQKISFCYFLKIELLKELKNFSKINFLSKNQSIFLKYKFSEIYRNIQNKENYNKKYSNNIYVLFYKKTLNKYKINVNF